MNGTFHTLTAAGPLVTGWSAHTAWMRRRLDRAHRDPLTGLFTRARFERAAARLLARRAPVAMVLLDLDGFKKLNDTFGHAAGDAALRSTAVSLNDALAQAPGSVTVRLGGDEFAAIVPIPDPAALMWLLSGLHGAVTAPFDHHGQSLAVGASIGAFYRSAPRRDLGYEVALRRADEAMYAAKRHGGGFRLTDDPNPAFRTVNDRREGRRGTDLAQASEGEAR